MLSKETFVKSMAYLKLYYGEQFKVNFDNDLVVKVWLEALANIENERFEYIIKSYAANNEFAPSNPTFILKHIEKLYIAEQPSFYKEWDKILKLRKEHRDIATGDVRMIRVLNALDKNSPTYKAIEPIQRELKQELDIYQEEKLKNEFRKTYEAEIMRLAKDKTLKLDDNILKLSV